MILMRQVGAAVRGLMAMTVFTLGGCAGGTAALTEWQHVKSGVLDVVLLSPHEALRHGRDAFVIEFRTAGGALVDVGEVRAGATMPMPGMPMFGSIDVQRSSVPGRYRANADFSMAGTWKLSIEWDGPAGKGSVGVSGSVR